jgi:ubiquitin-conjugating enzyme E2 J2
LDIFSSDCPGLIPQILNSSVIFFVTLQLITARPLEANVLEWHFLLHGMPSSLRNKIGPSTFISFALRSHIGPPETPYAGGVYWGKLVFPPEYPYKPPSIRMLTPSGRFKPGERICLSISDFHPDTYVFSFPLVNGFLF